VIDELATQLPAWLPTFLQRQRWFGAKARPVRACSIDDAVRLDADDRDALAICGVDFEDGTRQQYGLLLSRRTSPGDLPVLGRLAGGAVVVEASADPVSAASLLAGFASRARHPSERGGDLVHADAGPAVARILATPESAPVPMGAEQSNTTLRLGRSLIFKLIRRLEPGENPDVEVGRFLLTRTRFRRMPPLEGSIAYHSPAGETYTLGILQGWVESEGDGWSYVLKALARGAGRTEDAAGDLIVDMTDLGRVTAEFHSALASDSGSSAFAPEPISRDDLARWIEEARDQRARSFGLLQSVLGSLDEDARRLARDVLSGDAGHLLAGPHTMESRTRVSKTRIHGDFHLGQTLKTSSGFVLIDFEGEPARSLDERRRKTCVLKDVAGMLRSFDYAVETGARRAGDGRAARPATALRTAFLNGYFESARSAPVPLYPDSESERAPWLALFEYSKALYELEYEVNNRPNWVSIPLRGLLRMQRAT
jgi:trehalose synthase-fused probable maltokinase